ADLRQSTPFRISTPPTTATERNREYEEEGEQVRFRVERDHLVEALALASRVAGTRAAQPVLGGARLRASLDPSAVVVTATDLDIAVARRAQADVAEPGDVVVQARLAHDVARSLPSGPVDVGGAS